MESTKALHYNINTKSFLCALQQRLVPAYAESSLPQCRHERRGPMEESITPRPGVRGGELGELGNVTMELRILASLAVEPCTPQSQPQPQSTRWRPRRATDVRGTTWPVCTTALRNYQTGARSPNSWSSASKESRIQ